MLVQACCVCITNASDLLLISERCYLSRSETIDSLVNLSIDPVKFVHTVLFPRRISSIKIGLGALIVMSERAWFLEQVFLNLVSKRR